MRCVGKIRILLVTRESLRKDRNEGNVLLNLFDGLPVELAHICCKPELPDNDICKGRCFRITDKMVLQKILRGMPMGTIAKEETPHSDQNPQHESKCFYDFFRNHNWSLFYLLQDLLWRMTSFESPALDTFIDDFKPDIVFAPLTPYWYANHLQNKAIRRAGVPAVTYLYDDIYSLQQYSFSPFYWIHRFAVRSSIQKNLPLYSFAYTMTEQQKREYEKLLHIPMRVLRKCAPQRQCKRTPHDGIRMIYAGNIYYGRDKTLAMVADAVRAMQKEGQNVQMHIYTSSPIKRRMRQKLDDGTASIVHSAVCMQELEKQYEQSDIALHVESFQKKDALVTRLSFSTKIVDCLASGCAVLAICPEINAGWQYLQDESAALCISGTGQIEMAVRQLVTDDKCRERYAIAAQECIKRHHDTCEIKNKLYKELQQAVNNGGATV